MLTNWLNVEWTSLIKRELFYSIRGCCKVRVFFKADSCIIHLRKFFALSQFFEIEMQILSWRDFTYSYKVIKDTPITATTYTHYFIWNLLQTLSFYNNFQLNLTTFLNDFFLWSTHFKLFSFIYFNHIWNECCPYLNL